MVKILDSTLREGEQTFGVKFTLEQKVELAQLLDEARIDYIEAGNPSISDYDAKSVKAVANLELKARVLGHARAKKQDIDAVIESGCSWVGIFCGVNDLSLKYKLNGKTKQDIFSIIKDSINHAKQNRLRVRYTIEDATRTDIKDLIYVTKIARDSGADRICIADTTGCATPKQIKNLVSIIRHCSCPPHKIPIEVHCHNDYGLALANSLAAYEARTQVISVSVNGLGERAGITSLQELKVALSNLYGEKELKKGDFEPFIKLSKRVEEITGIKSDILRPIIGSNVFTHTAELHRKAVISKSETYEHLSPSLVERERKITFPNIIVPKKIPATELPCHYKNAPGERFVFVDDRFFTETKFYVSGRRVERIPKTQNTYIDPHTHNCESFLVFVGDGENLEGLRTNVNLNGKELEIDSPSIVTIPPYVNHTERLTNGRGWFFNIVRSPNYQSSLTKEERVLTTKPTELIRKAQRKEKSSKKGERPITSNLKSIKNPVRYIFDTKDFGLYVALHDINQDLSFAYKMALHYHDTDEMYVLFNRAGEQLTINLESNGQFQRVSSPALVYHKKGEAHKYSYVSGFGKLLIILEERKAGEEYHFIKTKAKKI